MADRGRARGRGMNAPISRGRGRGSAAPAAPARPPAAETLVRLGMSTALTDEVAEHQFEDAPVVSERNERDKPTNTTLQEGTEKLPSLNKEKQGNIETDTMSPPASKPAETSGSIGKTGSIQLSPKSPEYKPAIPSTLASEPAAVRLNPSAPEFNPPSSLVHNRHAGIPNKVNLLPLELNFPASTNGIGNHDNINQSTLLKLNRLRQTSSELNPKTSEFVPRLPLPQLNVKAPVFVPTNFPPPLPNGDMEGEVGSGISDSNNGFSFMADKEEAPSLKPKDIIHGFIPTGDREDDMVTVLKVTAEVLIKATLYPATFDRQKKTLETTIKAWLPNESTLLNLAEMLIHWGTQEANLRYMASRICQVLCDMSELNGGFKATLAKQLGKWFKKKEVLMSDSIVNFSLFYAELFSMLRVVSKEDKQEKLVPLFILASAIFELLSKLLDFVEDHTVIGACHILKLTGSLLESIQKEGETSKMEDIAKRLEELSINETLPLSRHCVEVIVRVLELRAKGWGRQSPLSLSSPSALNQFFFGDGSPSDSFGATDSFQDPVSNPDEWNEFLDDNNELIEDSDTTVPVESQPPISDYASGEEIDDEMMLQEYEEFVQELEDHLLNLGEVDPEQFQEQQH